MNERIKELMRQACKESNRPESVLEDDPQDVLEKFAELIVKECAEISKDNFHHGFAGARAMKEHFGVEE